MLYHWDPLQEDGAEAEHPEGDEHKSEALFSLFPHSLPPPSLSLLLSHSPLQHHLLPQPRRAKLTSSSDQLVVEDSSQRFPLSGNIPSQQLVTGI